MKRLALHLAFLGAMVTGCAPAQRVSAAQTVLGSVRLDIQAIVAAYNKKVNERIDECQRQRLETAEERHACLGPFAPDSPLSEAIRQLRPSYDISADGLQALKRALRVIELYRQGLEVEPDTYR